MTLARRASRSAASTLLLLAARRAIARLRPLRVTVAPERGDEASASRAHPETLLPCAATCCCPPITSCATKLAPLAA